MASRLLGRLFVLLLLLIHEEVEETTSLGRKIKYIGITTFFPTGISKKVKLYSASLVH